MGELTPFWRKEQLSEKELHLLSALHEAHSRSARRDNVSSHVMLNASLGSGDYVKSLCAAMLTLGGSHAPLEDTQHLLALDDPAERAGMLVQMGVKVPGWGNSFHKHGPDPLWSDVVKLIHAGWPEVHEKIAAVTGTLHKCGKRIFPNPSALTAATSIALGMPPQVAAYLFISARLSAWSEIFLNGQV